MTMQTSVLGRGLSSLIPAAPESTANGTPLYVAVEQIIPHPEQPRRHFDDAALLQLARSIREQGILQPLLVSAESGGTYRLIAGERRLRAAKMVQLTQVPVVVRATSSTEAFELALIENIQREDLNPIEEAEAFRRLLNEYKYTQAELAERVGKDRTTVTNALRLLKLRAPLREQLLAGQMSAGHARALLGTDDDALQDHIAQRIVAEGLSVRWVEKRVANARSNTRSKQSMTAGRSVKVQRTLAKRFQDHLGRAVQVRPSKRGGKLVLPYASTEDLRRLMAALGGSE
jgi:ParB family chromosome partitioning protein